MPVAEGRQMMTLQEACDRFNVPMSTLRYWITIKSLPRFKRGDGRVIVDGADVQMLLDKRNEIRPAD